MAETEQQKQSMPHAFQSMSESQFGQKKNVVGPLVTFLALDPHLPRPTVVKRLPTNQAWPLLTFLFTALGPWLLACGLLPLPRPLLVRLPFPHGALSLELDGISLLLMAFFNIQNGGGNAPSPFICPQSNQLAPPKRAPILPNQPHVGVFVNVFFSLVA